MKNQTKCE
jgi:dynein heavy chain